ncbi:MAG: RNA-binding S4 domain-containing protein [bacterium]|nr:RNA-binding S4 domain-containing protein [bacterium]
MSTRLDKYVWSVRLAKTRSQAADAISKGKVKLNGENVKPAKDVKIGDEINVIKHTATFTFKVLNILDRRVGAKLVPDYLLDITPEEEIEKLKIFQVSQKSYRQHGTGKPSKKDRRDLDDFLENW